MENMNVLTRRTLESQTNDGLSLKEKMKDAWLKQPPLIQSASSPENFNYAGMAMYWISGTFLFFFSQFYLIPAICAAREETMPHLSLLLRLLVLMTISSANANWLLCAERRSQQVKESTISEEERQKLRDAPYLPLGYRFCNHCQLYSPPRAYHCKQCHSCVLKRDYHCYITGSCVGFTSQRRYMPFLFHVSLASFLQLVLAAVFTFDRLGYDLAAYVPVVAGVQLLIGETSILDTLAVVQITACAIIMVVSWCYLTWEWLMVLRGQTSFEAARCIQTYRIGAFKSLYQVFGPMWWMNFLVPLPTTIPGNGVDWERKSQAKGR